MDEESLRVETRRRVYAFVRENPGYHLRELARSLGISATLAEYHLHQLEKHEIVASQMNGAYKRYFPRYTPGDPDRLPALSSREKTTLGFLRQRVPLRVLSFLMEREEGATHKEIHGVASVSPATLTHHLKKMVRAGVLIREPAGERRGYRVADGREVARILVSYRLVSPGQVDTFLRVWGEFRL